MTEAHRVAVEIGGKTYTLTPTIPAMKGINKHFGGYAVANRRLADVDFDAIIAVLGFGTGQTSGDELAALEEAVYRNGLNAEGLLTKIAEFLNVCAHGGRKPEPVGDDDGEAGNEPTPPPTL